MSEQGRFIPLLSRSDTAAALAPALLPSGQSLVILVPYLWLLCSSWSRS